MDFEQLAKIENESERVNRTYDIFNEDARLNHSKAARVEFLTTVHYIEKYLKDGDKIDRHKLLARLPGNGEVREYPGEQERDEALYAQESAEPLYDDFFHFATSFSNLVLLPCRM